MHDAPANGSGPGLGYPVIHGVGRFVALPDLLPCRRQGLVVVSEERVFRHWGGALLEALAGLPDRVACYAFPPGETNKNREMKARLEDRFLAERCGRDVVVLALGGGVVTDLAGFVAATYLRGVPWVALPTTLLGMVDAAIGGKVGVNTPAGKNLVGAFHRPLAVVADLRTLTTLPDEVLRSGLAEMVKHAALADRGLLDDLATGAAAFALRDLPRLEPLVARAAAIKAAVVAQDEHEAGLRQVLNFGHTVGHALEAASGLALPHGLAVAIGMVAEARAATRAGRFPAEDLARLVEVLQQLGLPTRPPGPLPDDALREAFAVDKKNRDAVVRFSLPRALGDVGDGSDGYSCALDLDEVLRALWEPA